MKREISNSDDIIDSRDVIARIAELEDERQTLADALKEAREAHEVLEEGRTEEQDAALADAVDEAGKELEQWDEGDEGAELKALKALAEEGEGCADWPHGEALIRDSYFEDYARELAEDIGAIGRDLPWPVCHIDWKAAAEALQMDYTSVDYDGITYWVRS